MTRRTADVLYSAVRIFEIAKLRGQADQIKPEWEAGLRAGAEAQVKVWEKIGEENRRSSR